MDNIKYSLNNMPVGFFDSGVGGLSVYSVFRRKLPLENTMYYGDLKNMPYGNKTKEELTGYARKILNFFKANGVKAVVIACNTSSANVYDIIKDDYDFKIYPIIQSCAKVIASQSSEIVGVFATEATIKSGAYEREITKYNPNLKVVGISCPMWTNFVEHDMTNSDICIRDVKSKAEEIMQYSPEKIILGCTHYPYLKHVLSQFIPENMLIDPAEIFVDFIKQDMQEKGLLNTENTDVKEEFFVSANQTDFKNNAQLFYKLTDLPELV